MFRKDASANPRSDRASLYEDITSKIITELEAGRFPWVQPWGSASVNALLHEIATTGDRVILIEDTRELQCAAPNLVALRTKDGVASLTDLVRSALRLRPDRIPIGEVRGPEALDLLKAWGTGHPGGIATLHAGTAIGALLRLEQLMQEAVVTVPRPLIADTIDVIAVLSGRGAQRRLGELTELAGLQPDGSYRLQAAPTP